MQQFRLSLTAPCVWLKRPVPLQRGPGIFMTPGFCFQLGRAAGAEGNAAFTGSGGVIGGSPFSGARRFRCQALRRQPQQFPAVKSAEFLFEGGGQRLNQGKDFFLSPVSGELFPYRLPASMLIPQKAPHTSRMRPMPAPRGEDSFRAVSSVRPQTSAKAAKTDWEQLYPWWKYSSARAARSSLEGIMGKRGVTALFLRTCPLRLFPACCGPSDEA